MSKLPYEYVVSAADARSGRDGFADVERYCMFIGYPRSGHSLFGSLLSAHRNAVLGDEVDVLRYVRLGFSREQIYSLILRSDAAFTARGRQAYVHNYAVEGQWQGRVEQLRVIGDKKGGNSTWQLAARPHLFETLEERVADPVAVVHVTRNPYDNVAAIFRMPVWRGDLNMAYERYARLCDGVAAFRSRLGTDRIHDARHEDMIDDPHTTLRGLTGFLGLDAPPDYLEACAAMLYREPNRVRHQVEWPSGLRDRVAALADRHDFLRGYAWES